MLSKNYRAWHLIPFAYKYAKLWSNGFDWHDVFRQPRELEIVDVIEDVNLTVRKGEFVTLVGPSGSGQTTLVEMLGSWSW